MGVTLGPYVAFDEALPPLNQTTLDVMAANVVRIVAAEGPVFEGIARYTTPIGMRMEAIGLVRKSHACLIERSCWASVEGRSSRTTRQNESGVKPRTYRLPRPRPVVPRHLGPRSLELVPPAELAHHLTDLVIR